MDYLTAQFETWGSHKNVRHYWGFSELQDYDTECTDMSESSLSEAVSTCKAAQGYGDAKIKSFFGDYYGISEGNRVRSNDAGWLCAQRRVGRALGWLHYQYVVKDVEIPQYLAVVDDDTYIDLVDVISYLKKEEQKTEGRAFARAGCVFQENDVLVLLCLIGKVDFLVTQQTHDIFVLCKCIEYTNKQDSIPSVLWWIWHHLKQACHRAIFNSNLLQQTSLSNHL